MSFAELIEKLQTLPADKQSEVIDFVEFLANRIRRDSLAQESKIQSALSAMRSSPLTVRDFSPMSRDEANAR